MTVPLTGAGSLFVRLGHLFGRLADVTSLRGGSATTNVISAASMPTNFGTTEADFAAGSALRQVVDSLLGSDLAAWQAAQQSLYTALQTRAINCLKAMVSIDTLAVPGSASLALLTQIPLQTALQTLVTQMAAAAASVNASVPTLGAQTNVGTPTGNPVTVGSLKNGQGLTIQYPYPETLTFTCTADSQTGGATAGNETLAIIGQQLVSDPFSPLWPGGSGLAASLQAVDGSKSNATGNALQNSDFFTTTTPNQPDNWSAPGPGVIGTDIFTDTGNAYTTGGGSLKLLGTGSALLDCVTQSFNTTPNVTSNAGGTTFALKPDTVYLLNCWIKCSATPATGVLEFALIDGSAGIGTVYNDDQAVANLFTKSLTAVSTSWVNVNGAFRTPAVLPAALPLKLRVRLSTAIDSGKSVYLGRMSLTPATQLYAGGPFFGVFSGNTRMIAGLTPDSWTMAVGLTAGLMQSWMARVFGLNALGITIPNNVSPTIADSLLA
jgi:hypothetical protein